MRPEGHAAVSTILSAGVYALSRDWTATALCWIAGVLIDLDHVLDFLLQTQRITGVFTLIEHYAESRFTKCYIFLHGWEWIPLWAAGFWATGRPDLGAAWLVGYTAHIVIDQFTNHLHPLCYFLTFRIRHRFEPVPLGAKKHLK